MARKDWHIVLAGCVAVWLLGATGAQAGITYDAGLGELVPKVRSGDPANVEAEASRRYYYTRATIPCQLQWQEFDFSDDDH